LEIKIEEEKTPIDKAVTLFTLCLIEKHAIRVLSLSLFLCYCQIGILNSKSRGKKSSF